MESFWQGLGIGAVLGVPVFCFLAGIALVTWAEKGNKNDK